MGGSQIIVTWCGTTVKKARFSGLPGGAMGGGGEAMAELLAYHEPASGPV